MALTLKRSRSWPGVRWELAALTVVLIVSALSWRMITDVATAVYLQTAPLGDPPLAAVDVPGPEPYPVAGSPPGPVSRLGHYGYFWSERAFHYRTFLMFAGDAGPGPGLLAHDTWQQHPDGIDAWREYTLLMEPVYGWLYRALGDQSRPPVEFLLWLIPLLHVLILPLLYLCARGVGTGRSAAVAGVLFYAGCTLGFQRLSGSLLLKEDFALLLLAGFLAAHAWSARRPGRLVAATAGLLLMLFLAGWHLSQFLALVVLGTAALWHLGSPARDRRTPLVYTLAVAAAGLTPSLWAKGFLLGPVMALMVAWLLADRLVRRGDRARVGAFVVLGLALLGASFLNRLYSGDYSHVFGLLLEKIRHGFVRPSDPLTLPFAVRIFWAPPFNTPTVHEIQAKLGLSMFWLPVLAVWTVWALARGKVRGVGAGLLAAQLVMLAGYLLVERLGVVFLVFGALAAAMFTQYLQDLLAARGMTRASLLALAVLAVTPVLNLRGDLAPMIHISNDLRRGRAVRLRASDQGKWSAQADLMRWITSRTPGPGAELGGEPAAFLAEVGLSPELLLYCRRPMALNSQFENAGIRERYRRYLELLYGHDEQALADFAADLDVSFLVIDRDMATRRGPGSLAWTAGVGGDLDRDMVVVRMHLDPGSLRRFQVVFDNSRYRVLARDGASVGRVVRSRSCWWNAGWFTVEHGKLVSPEADRRRLKSFLRGMSDLQTRQDRMLAAVARKWGHGRRPDLMALHRALVESRLEALQLPSAQALEAETRSGRLENAIAARLSEIEPASGEPLGQALGTLVGRAGDGGFLGLLADGYGEPVHYAAAGQLLAMIGRYAAAAAQFESAAELCNDPRTGALPRHPDAQVRQLWLETAWWTFAAGDRDMAAELASRYLAILDAAGGEGGEVVGILRKLAALDTISETRG